jgi:hypothetical protein
MESIESPVAASGASLLNPITREIINNVERIRCSPVAIFCFIKLQINIIFGNQMSGLTVDSSRLTLHAKKKYRPL